MGATRSAATPHLHVHLWVRDPDDALTVEHLRPAVESFCRNTPDAHIEDHPVGTDESDAAVIDHDAARYDEVGDETLLDLFHDRGDEGFPMNTVTFVYILNQRPEWTIKRIYDDGSTFEEEREALEGAATAWASSRRWLDGNLARSPPTLTFK